MLLRNPGLMAAQRQGSLCGLAAGPRRTVRHLRSCRAAASAPAKLQFWNITCAWGWRLGHWRVLQYAETMLCPKAEPWQLPVRTACVDSTGGAPGPI